jgi:hypothetical protein
MLRCNVRASRPPLPIGTSASGELANFRRLEEISASHPKAAIKWAGIMPNDSASPPGKSNCRRFRKRKASVSENQAWRRVKFPNETMAIASDTGGLTDTRRCEGLLSYGPLHKSTRDQRRSRFAKQAESSECSVQDLVIWGMSDKHMSG